MSIICRRLYQQILKILSSVDEKVWPSAKETKKAFIDGFAPYSLKEAIKRSDPEDLRTAAEKAREICKGVIHAESA